MSHSLLPLAATQLRDIAAGELQAGNGHANEIGAMPPSFVAEVRAEKTPENHASIRVLQKLGFVQVGGRSDEDGEQVPVWTLRPSTAPGAGS